MEPKQRFPGRRLAFKRTNNQETTGFSLKPAILDGNGRVEYAALAALDAI